LSKIPAGIFCSAASAKGSNRAATGTFRAVLNRAKVSIHDSP
jgi:hypothetical protein